MKLNKGLELYKLKPSTYKIINNLIFINSDSNVDIYDLEACKYIKGRFRNLISTIFSENFFAVVDSSKFQTYFYNFKFEKIVSKNFVIAASKNEKVAQTDKYFYSFVYLNHSFENQFIGIISKDDYSISNVYKIPSFRKLALVISNEMLLEINESTLFKSTFTNNILWKKDFSTLAYHHSAYLDSEIILIDNKIYFSINTESEGKPGIFCLDVHSGETLNFYPGNYYGLFKDGNNLYSTMYKNILVKIDSETDQIQTFDTNPLLKENDFHTINDQRCSAKKGKFYFTQTFGAHNAKFGIIDFENQQLDYKYDFDKKNGAIGSIKLSDNRVFIHTQDNTLHIFEEENSKT